jgi:hypothetical protein
VDNYLQRHRVAVIALTVGVVLAGLPLLMHLPFDFNPINLQNPAASSVVTYRELQRNPETSGNDAEILAPSLDQANDTAKRLAAIPEVSRVLTISSLIPADQDRKIAIIGAASKDLTAALNVSRQPAPTDQDVIAAIRDAAAALSKVAGSAAGPGAEFARRVSDLLVKLAQTDTAVRSNAEAAVIPPLIYDLDGLRKSLDPQEITLKTLPASLVGTWLLPDGRARVEVLPNGDPTPAFCENLPLRCWPPNRRRQVRRSATSSRVRR